MDSCESCAHHVATHRPSDGTCLACLRSGGLCSGAAEGPVAVAEPEVAEYARVVPDYAPSGIDEEWRADREARAEYDEDAADEYREPSGIAAFVERSETEKEASAARVAEAVRYGEELAARANAGKKDHERIEHSPRVTRFGYPSEEEEQLDPVSEAKAKDKEYLGASVPEIMQHPTAHGGKSSSGSKGRRSSKPGDSVPPPIVGRGIGGVATRLAVGRMSRGEREYYQRDSRRALGVLQRVVEMYRAEYKAAREEQREPVYFRPAIPADRTEVDDRIVYEVYGLDEYDEFPIFAADEGLAFAFLVADAYEHDAVRIRMRDAA